ncbi:MAG: hypothetical protein ACKO1J_14400 [Tagaea sp.]
MIRRSDFEAVQSPSKLLANCLEAFHRIPEEDLLLRRGVAKDIVEEAFPLAILLTQLHSFGDRWSVGLLPPNSSADARIQETETGRTIPFQIVSGNGNERERNDRLRMEIFLQKRSVPMTGSVKRIKDSAGKKSAVATREAVSRDAESADLASCIAAAIEAKAQKDCTTNTSLLVHIDDWNSVQYLSAAQLGKLISVVCKRATKAIDAFSNVYLVGISGKTIVDFKSGHAISGGSQTRLAVDR